MRLVPISLEMYTAGIFGGGAPGSFGITIKDFASLSSLLKMMAPVAPASEARTTFCVKDTSPRDKRIMLPVQSIAKSLLPKRLLASTRSLPLHSLPRNGIFQTAVFASTLLPSMIKLQGPGGGGKYCFIPQ